MPHKVSFPQFGDYWIPFEHLVTRGLEAEYVVPPPMTKRTLELGGKYQPGHRLRPLQVHPGQPDRGFGGRADLLVETGGACRLGYYGELQEQILRDLAIPSNLSIWRGRTIPSP